MADSFNGVTLHTFLKTSGNNPRGGAAAYVPQWEQEPNVSVRHIPYTSRDLVQFGGRGNFTLTLPIRIDNNSDITTLQGYVDGSPHTLVYNGTTYNNVYLTGVRRVEQMGIGANNSNWTAELSFIRQGT